MKVFTVTENGGHQSTWSEHIDKMCKKISQRLGVIRRIRHIIKDKTCKLLCNALVIPYFDYCDVIINNTFAKHINRLQKLQNRSARCILKEHHRAHASEMLDTLGWLNVSKRTELHQLSINV